MKNKNGVYLCSIICLFNITIACQAQKLIKNIKYFHYQNYSGENDVLALDTLRYRTSYMLFPRKSNDKLIVVLRNALLKDNKDFKNLTNDGYYIENLLSVKSYTKSSFISIVQNRYYEGPYLHNISFSTKCYNFILYNGVVFEIFLKSDKALNDSINSVVLRTFDKDCLLNEELSNKYQIYFYKGEPYINNPLSSRVCDDSLFIPDLQRKIYIARRGK